MKKTFLLITLLTSLASCTDNFKLNDIHVNINTSMPAGALNYTDQSLLALSNLGDILVVNDDKVLSVVYSKDMNLVSNDEIGKFFTFPTQKLEFNYEFPLTKSAENNQELSVRIPIELTGFNDNEIINEILFKSGYLRLSINNVSVADLLGVRWWIPQLLDKKGNAVGGAYGKTIDLAGLLLKPEAKNTLEIVISGKLPIINSLRGNLEIKSDRFDSFKGWLGRKEIAIDPIQAQFGSDFQEFNKYVGEAYFADPKLSFKVNNSVGASVLLSIDKVYLGDKIINLKQGIDNSKFLIQGESETIITIDNSMTIGGNELSQAITRDADAVNLILSAIVNPNKADDGVEPNTKVNTINQDSNITGKYKVELPMDGWFKDILFEEKISSIDLKTDNITYDNILMAFTGANSMPLDIELTGYAGSVSTNNNLFDHPAIIPSALSDNQAYQIGKDNMIVVNMNKESIDKLIKNKNLMFRFKASTRGADKKERVRFYSPTSIKLNVFMGVKADIY